MSNDICKDEHNHLNICHHFRFFFVGADGSLAGFFIVVGEPLASFFVGDFVSLAFDGSEALGLSGSSGFIGILQVNHQHFCHGELSFSHSPVDIHDIILLFLQACHGLSKRTQIPDSRIVRDLNLSPPHGYTPASRGR
jgi:hypothetical protein